MQDWEIVKYFLIIAVLLFIGKALKNIFPILNKIVVPTAIIAGVLGLSISLIGMAFEPDTYDFTTTETESVLVEYNKDADQAFAYMVYRFNAKQVAGYDEITLVVKGPVGKTLLIRPNEADELAEAVELTFTGVDQTVVLSADAFTDVLIYAEPGIVSTIGTLEIISAVLVKTIDSEALPYDFTAGWIKTDRDFFEIDVDMTNAIVYHALAIGFIALSLKKEENKNKRKAWSTGMIITSTYAIQGVIGIVLVMLLFRGVSISAGMLLPLGFGQGPALAMSFGNIWTEMLNNQGRALGASFAFLGFLWGGIVGVIAINFLARKKGTLKPENYLDTAVQKHTIEIDSVREISVLDGLTTQLVIISVIYALVWLTIMGFEALLYNPAGGIGNTVFGIIKSFNFILGIAYALAYKQILKWLEKKGKNVGFMTNNYLLSNISSTAFNYMIAGAVLTITIDFLVDYGWLLMVVTTVGGIATLFFVRFLCQRVYPKYKDEYFVALYGMLTGVASTGIALLKGLDRQLETPVAEDLVMGSGTAIMMALPLFGILMLPGIAFGTASQGLIDYIVLFGCLLYAIIVVVILLIRARRKPINEEKKV